MEKKFQLTITLLITLTLAFFSSTVLAQDISPDKTLTYQAQVQDIGWMNPVGALQEAGTTGKSKALETLKVNTGADASVLGVEYSAHVANIGWQDPVSNGQEAGTVGKALPVEAVKIQLTGSAKDQYQVYYQVHSANFGWLDWAKDGQVAGTTGCAFPVEAIKIAIVKNGEAAPGATDHPSISRSDFAINMKAHVSNIGWQDPVQTTGVIGTTGKGLPIEAVEAKASDPTGKSGVQAQAYVKGVGWQNFGPVNTAVGTTGQAKPIEAIRFQLVGPIAQVFDIQYHAHSANIGWLPWTGNSNISGTSGAGFPIEAVEFGLVPKGTLKVDKGAYMTIDSRYGAPLAADCIMMSIDKQRMALYKNYQVVLDTNIVTGMAGIDDTRRGNFKVEEKVNYFRTVGPGYDAICTYWLTLYNGDVYGFNGEGHIIGTIGIHDAGWRTNWSSTAYQGDGSHGCVNTPTAAMAQIFNSVSVGTPVGIR